MGAGNYGNKSVKILYAYNAADISERKRFGESDASIMRVVCFCDCFECVGDGEL